MIQHLLTYWRYLRLPRPVREELSQQGYARDRTKLDVITRLLGSASSRGDR